MTARASEGKRVLWCWNAERAAARFKPLTADDFVPPIRAGVCDFDAVGVTRAALHGRSWDHVRMGFLVLLASGVGRAGFFRIGSLHALLRGFDEPLVDCCAVHSLTFPTTSVSGHLPVALDATHNLARALRGCAASKKLLLRPGNKCDRTSCPRTTAVAGSTHQSCLFTFSCL